jgi:hypothetical protein
MQRKRRIGKILRLGALGIVLLLALIGFTLGPAFVAKRSLFTPLQSSPKGSGGRSAPVKIALAVAICHS